MLRPYGPKQEYKEHHKEKQWSQSSDTHLLKQESLYFSHLNSGRIVIKCKYRKSIRYGV